MPGLGRAGHRAGDHGVEEDAELSLLLGDLGCPPCEPEPTEGMVGGSRGDGIWLPAALDDGRECVLPAPADADVEPGRVQAHVGVHDPREEDVPDPVVDDVRPFDPVLLDEHAAEAEVGGDGRDLARVVRLDAADRHQRVAAPGERVRREVLQLAHLVAAVRKSRVAVLALRPDLDGSAEMVAQPLEAVEGRGAEEERHALEVGESHARQCSRTP